MEDPDQIEARIKKIEAALGITGLTTPAVLTCYSMHPIGVVFITALDTPPDIGEWELDNKGSLLGGTDVYAWRRVS